MRPSTPKPESLRARAAAQTALRPGLSARFCFRMISVSDAPLSSLQVERSFPEMAVVSSQIRLIRRFSHRPCLTLVAILQQRPPKGTLICGLAHDGTCGSARTLSPSISHKCSCLDAGFNPSIRHYTSLFMYSCLIDLLVTTQPIDSTSFNSLPLASAHLLEFNVITVSNISHITSAISSGEIRYITRPLYISSIVNSSN